MSKDYSKELSRMESLMNYGMTESKQSNDTKGIIEYSQLGADGRTYAILREGTKYYVKVAPKKDTKVLAEDYDYIGGFLNRKSYDSYTKASNALNRELIYVNENNGSKKPVKSQFALNETAEWQNTNTKEAREELNRFYQIVSNVDGLLNENVHYIKEDSNDPFNCKPSTKDGGGHKGNVGSQQPLGIKDKNFVDGNTKNADSLQKKYEKGNMGKSGFGDHNIGEDGGNAYQEKPKTSKEQGKSISEGKKKHVIKLSEEQKKQVLAWRNDRAFVHNSSDSELDRSHGTEIGDTAPWDETVNENFDTTEWDDGLPGSAGIGEPKKYKKPFDNQKGVRQPVSEEYIFEFRADDGDDEPLNDFGGEYGNDDISQSANNIMNSNTDDNMDDNIYKHLDQYGEGSDSLGVDFSANGEDFDELVKKFGTNNGEETDEFEDGNSDVLNDIPVDDTTPVDGDTMPVDDDTMPVDDDTTPVDDDTMPVDDDTTPVDDDMSLNEVGVKHASGSKFNEFDTNSEYNAIQETIRRITEDVLHDFGKHPAYRKKPMTLPKNADGSQWGEDWNDESTKGEQPYGQKIGHSGDPYEDVVGMITNAVVTQLSKKKE